jgi:hypothetical protein
MQSEEKSLVLSAVGFTVKHAPAGFLIRGRSGFLSATVEAGVFRATRFSVKRIKARLASSIITWFAIKSARWEHSCVVKKSRVFSRSDRSIAAADLLAARFPSRSITRTACKYRNGVYASMHHTH